VLSLTRLPLSNQVRRRKILRTSPRDGVLRSHPPVAADDDHSHPQEQEHGAQQGFCFSSLCPGRSIPNHRFNHLRWRALERARSLR
jgi:hypothetical protein